jgi:hypothetical protein
MGKGEEGGARILTEQKGWKLNISIKDHVCLERFGGSAGEGSEGAMRMTCTGGAHEVRLGSWRTEREYETGQWGGIGERRGDGKELKRRAERLSPVLLLICAGVRIDDSMFFTARRQ